MPESNSNEGPVDILASFENGDNTASDDAVSGVNPETQDDVFSGESGQLTADAGFEQAIPSSNPWEGHETDDIQLVAQETTTSPKKAKEDIRGFLNESDTIKMKFIVSIQVFLVFGLAYYAVVLMTVSGMEIGSVGLTTQRFSQLHFILYIIFTFSLARVFVHCFEYVGDRFFDTQALGIVANTFSILGLAWLYIDHFNLGNVMQDLIRLLPFG